MVEKTENGNLLSELAHFTGSEVWYRHNLVRRVTYTQGVQYLAEKAGAYWLVDEIAIGQMEPKIRREEFQVWKLARHGDNRPYSATLSVEDGNGNQVFSKEIEFTDFPLPEITIWFTDNVILLPSEY